MKRVLVACIVWMAMVCLAQAADAPKLKGLWLTGGCCHDYSENAKFLTKKIGEYANVEFKIVNHPDSLKVLKDKDYANDYDVVVYDLCYADEKDMKLVNNMTGTIRDGKPTVIIHCSLHTFMVLEQDDWREAMGIKSTSHDTFREISTKKAADHPIIKYWPDDWKTPGEELYRNIKVWPTVTPLLTAYSVESKKDHVVAWTNAYGKGRVFATTLGHDKMTIDKVEYPHLLANGLLWACDKLDDQGNPVAGYAGSGAK